MLISDRHEIPTLENIMKALQGVEDTFNLVKDIDTTPQVPTLTVSHTKEAVSQGTQTEFTKDYRDFASLVEPHVISNTPPPAALNKITGNLNPNETAPTGPQTIPPVLETMDTPQSFDANETVYSTTPISSGGHASLLRRLRFGPCT